MRCDSYCHRSPEEIVTGVGSVCFQLTNSTIRRQNGRGESSGSRIALSPSIVRSKIHFVLSRLSNRNQREQLPKPLGLEWREIAHEL
jgi:hypothetical protein